MSVQVLLDNTVLSNFALVGQTHLLRDSLGRRAATVAEVVQEYERGVLLGRTPPLNWQWITIYGLAADELELYQTFLRKVSAGEAACLTVAYLRTMAVFTDDRDARQIAIQYGIPVSGTIGVLVEATRRNILSLEQANRVLLEMIHLGYRAPFSTLDSLL